MKERICKPIVLVGLMGAGKTSVGKMLARHLGLRFIDSDTEIEKAAGCSVSEIFSLYGEAEFRRGEVRVMERILEERPMVLSTGEGAFISEEVRALIKEKAISLWLKADLDLLVKRTAFRDTRPLLLENDPKHVLQRLMDKRYPIYAQADIMVETKDEPTRNTLQKVLRVLEDFLNQQGYA